MSGPSTSWREVIGADEESRHAAHAKRFVAAQAKLSAKHGAGRALHRRGVMALAGTLRVRGDVPEHARHGLFAKEGEHEVWIRLSNGSGGKASDARPDVRGFAIKVRGVQGPGALGRPTESQDFALINQETFAMRTSDDFVDLAMAAGEGPRALLRYLIRKHGFFGGLRQAGRLKRSLDRPFAGFAVERFFSAAPIACGPYAAKVRLLPLASRGDAEQGPVDWRARMERHLAGGPLRYHLQLQFFVDEETTPIENPTVPWPETTSPYVTVADLVIPRALTGKDDEELTRAVEAATFDPWSALAEHRPLGEIMRARKVTYYESQKARGAA